MPRKSIHEAAAEILNKSVQAAPADKKETIDDKVTDKKVIQSKAQVAPDQDNLPDAEDGVEKDKTVKGVVAGDKAMLKMKKVAESMTDEKIKELYANDEEMTLKGLSEMTGKSIPELRAILLEGDKMSADEIKDMYDSNPNMTLQELARKTGMSISELKKILMEDFLNEEDDESEEDDDSDDEDEEEEEDDDEAEVTVTNRKTKLSEALRMIEDTLKETTVDVSEGVRGIKSLSENGELSEQFKSDVQTLVEATVVDKVNSYKKQLVEALEPVLENYALELAEELETRVDTFVQTVADAWLEENEIAVESSLRTSITEDFISGLRHLFMENYIDIPEEKVDVVEELSRKVEDLEEGYNEKVEQLLELQGALNEERKERVLDYMTDNLTESQADKIRELVEGFSYSAETHENFVNKVETLIENYLPESASRFEGFEDEDMDSGALIAEEARPVIRDKTMANYAKEISKLNKR